MATTQTQTIQSSVLHGIKDLRIEERQIEAPQADELQVSVRSTGLCGSDLHYYHHFRNGDILIREPMSLGHESAGVVAAVGSGVADSGDFKVGDRVALEVGLPCGVCDRCAEGRYNICKGMRFRSSAKAFPHFQGTLQERINHPAKWCHKLPDNVSLDEGALLEPLSVAIHAVRRSNLQPGATTLVLGAGAVGILVAAMLKVQGARTIVITDIESRRVDFALANGFADTGFVMPRKRGSTIDEKLGIAKEAAELATTTNAAAAAAGSKTDASEGKGTVVEFDAVFECTGVESCLQTAIYATRPGGRVMLIGMGTPIQTLPISAAALREVDLVGVFRYASTYEYGISLLRLSKTKGREEESSLIDGLSGEKKGEEASTTTTTGRPLPDLSKLATHRYKGLDKAVEAFEQASKPMDDEGNLVMKVFIEVEG